VHKLISYSDKIRISYKNIFFSGTGLGNKFELKIRKYIAISTTEYELV